MLTGPPLRLGRQRFPLHVLVFIGPAFVLYTVLMVYPIVNTVSLSLYKPIAPGLQTTFAGIDNYIKLVSARPWDCP